MSRPKLSSPSQPAYLRWTLRLYEFAASLSLAVVLIFSSALALGLATFVEAAWGTPVVQFYVYQSWWFELILLLLAVNIFCAAAIRYPWKRHQTGFVVTHIGLLTLLFGAYLGRNQGIDAQVSVFEGLSDKWAIENAVKLNLTVTNHSTAGSTDVNASTGAQERVEIPFSPGLFNWEDWNTVFAFRLPEDENIEGWGRLPWQFFRHTCGYLFKLTGQYGPGQVVYERDAIKLEVLDYYSDAKAVTAPYVSLRVTMPKMMESQADGTLKAGAMSWVPVELSVLELPSQPEYPNGWCEKQPRGGGTFSLQLATTAAQVESFLRATPEGPLGQKGQVVLSTGGKQTRVNVDAKLGQGKFPLAGKDGWFAEVVEYWPFANLTTEEARLKWQNDRRVPQPYNPAVKVALFEGDKPQGELLLLALESHSSVVDHERQIFGEYWFDHSNLDKDEREKAGVTARIDILQGPDHKLYYRYWNREKVVFARELPSKGSTEDAVDAFRMPIPSGDQPFTQLKLYVNEFVPGDKPLVVPIKRPFTKDALIGQRTPAAKFRLTVDGESDEFWLWSFLNTPDAKAKNSPNQPTRIHAVSGEKQRVAALTMPLQAIDIGFRVKLNKFERKLDPGTDQASHYSSWVDFVDRDADRALFVYSPGNSAAAGHPQGSVKRPQLAALDAARGRLYYYDEAVREIRSVSWEKFQTPHPRGELLHPQDVDLQALDDEAAERLDRKTVVATGLHRPTALVIDSESERLYWSDSTPRGRAVQARPAQGLIRGVDFDGKNLATLATLDQLVDGLALDVNDGALYFATRQTGPKSQDGGIGKIVLRTQAVDDKLWTGLSRAQGLALDAKNQQLLVTELGQKAIRRIRLGDLSEKLLLSRAAGSQPLEIVVDPSGETFWFLESFDNPAFDANKLPTSKPKAWRLVGATLAGGVVAEFERQLDEPSGLAWVGDGKLAWTQTAVTRTDVWITMNAPVDCFDPYTGRAFRLFQESFAGPFQPGEEVFDSLVPADSRKSELYQSVLTVNYDPGRGVRNVGCLLVCLGIALMFYMRAYFFKPKARATPVARPVLAKT